MLYVFSLIEHASCDALHERRRRPLRGRNRDVTGATSHTVDEFAVFFIRKIERVRHHTAGLPPPSIINSTWSSFTSFRSCSQEEVRKIVMLSPIKSCALDPVPTFILREFIDVILPFVTHTVIASLLQGQLPDSQKDAIVTPLLKRPGLDTADMNNYRPVSNLFFILKLRVVANQLSEYLSPNDLLPCFQSTETALLRVWSDMLIAADERKVTLLSLLDTSAAFDCVDHLILLQRLQGVVGIWDSTLDWIRLFLSGRTQQMVYDRENRLRRRCCSAFHTAWYSDHCCTSSTGHNCSTSSRNIGSTLINTPTTCNCINACRRRTLGSLLAVSMHVSSTSKPS